MTERSSPDSAEIRKTPMSTDDLRDLAEAIDMARKDYLDAFGGKHQATYERNLRNILWNDKGSFAPALFELADRRDVWDVRRAPAQAVAKPMAYYIEHKKFGVELSLEQPDALARIAGWTSIPLYADPAPPQAARRPTAFLAWACATFGPVAKVRSERLMRFVEEAIELAHADGMERSMLDAIAGRIYGRDRGEIKQEIGQAQACLETYAESIGESADALAEIEWQRVQSIPQSEWERRHAAKQAIGIALSRPQRPEENK